MSSALDRLAKRGVSAPGERGIDIPLDKVRFDPTQPRKAFHHLDGRVAISDEEYIAELAETIEENGLIQAITVQEMADGTYLVVVGECRTRAHLLLGKPTIRAVVRNDLTNASRRLLYQLVENVTRQKLTDQELAEAIQKLKNGGDGVEPMSQVQIAKVLGKSEGWVSRFVKFGDEELQRVWVKSGIADSVEHVYRLSILPAAMQVDICRRVALPETDAEWLEKPLRRETIEKLAKEARIGKKKDAPPTNIASEPSHNEMVSDASPGAAPVGGSGSPASDGWTHRVNGVSIDTKLGASDSTNSVEGDAEPMDERAQGRALADAVMNEDASASSAMSNSAPGNTGTYQLPENARAAILGSAGQVSASEGPKEVVQAPVNCRVPLGKVIALLATMKEDTNMREALNSVQCELNIPGAMAQLIANQLAGVIVDRKEVPALMQRELMKLD
jgi:ParB/RepB/Spo0J family partition protein